MTPEQEARLKKVEDFMNARQAQQITFPLDQKSIEILQNYFMRITGTLSSFGVGGDVETSYIGNQADLQFIAGKNQYIPYVADPANDLIVPTLPVGFEEDQKLFFITDDTFPGGINPGTDYFVINATAESFQITTVQGDPGSIVNITTVGAGRQWLWSFGF